jgi:3-hydroxyacyl-CoA dehydrogenase
MTLGGGLELCFACDAVQAAAETYSGLVEVGVGLIPGGAGNLNMLWRALEASPRAPRSTLDLVDQDFKNIALAKVATSAVEAKQLRLLPPDGRRVFDKRASALRGEAARDGPGRAGYHPPAPRPTPPGRERHRDAADDGRHARGRRLRQRARRAHRRKVAEVLCGGVAGNTREVTEEELLELEREAFVACAASPRARSACSTCS